jgi:hypothetical protein
MGYSQYLRPSFLESLGQKVKNGVDMFGKAKGLYETGKALVSAYETLAPVLSQAASFIPYVL